MGRFLAASGVMIMSEKIDNYLSAKEKAEKIKANPELAEKMINAGWEILYDRGRVCHMWWSQKGYKMTLVDYEPYSKYERLFDNPDDFKTDFLKLKPRNPNRDWERDFEKFMFIVKDVKQFYDIN